MNDRIRALAEKSGDWWDYTLVSDQKFLARFADLVAAEREWVRLTDEEISAIDWKTNETLHEYARHIEAKCREKNT